MNITFARVILFAFILSIASACVTVNSTTIQNANYVQFVDTGFGFHNTTFVKYDIDGTVVVISKVIFDENQRIVSFNLGKSPSYGSFTNKNMMIEDQYFDIAANTEEWGSNYDLSVKSFFFMYSNEWSNHAVLWCSGCTIAYFSEAAC